MNPNSIVEELKNKLQTAQGHFQDEIKKVRTGRAHPSMLDSITVVAYGAPMPLNQLANVVAPEAQLLQITPFDPNNLQAIASAIRDNPSLGLNPMDDGRVVRVPIPPLTEERRRELAKTLGSKLEDALVTMRNIRRDAMEAIDQAKKNKQIGEDDAKRLEKQVDEEMNKAKTDAETAAKAKEAEIMTV